MKYQVILLNGPSSSGKSTLSRNIQTILSDYEIISIDDFMKIGEDETIYEDDVYDISGDMCEATLEHLKRGKGVIIDHVITSQRIYEQLLDYLKEYAVLKVRVSCPLEVLLQREIDRGNRCPGSAEASFQYLYPQEGYDLTVDTHAMTSKDCAKVIAEYA